jgi:hypothetical protein
MVAGRGNTSTLGKVLTFFGVMLLVVGLFGGDAGASGKGSNANSEGGKSGAFGLLKKSLSDAVDAVADAADAAPNADCGEYCSTTDGTPSGNGNGGGNGNQPCAGCVGNADNVNPPGQFKDGGDPNNGYECDGNNGIAKGNPAHSGCKNPVTTTTVPQTTTTVPQTTTTVPQTTTTAPTTTTAGPTTTVAVGGVSTTAPEVQGVQFSRAGGDLASTGAGFMRPFTLLGALLLLVGVALMIVKVNPSASRA